MITKTVFAVLLLTTAAAATHAGSAAENPVTPQMHTGLTNRAPKTFTVSPRADQITAREAIGADIRDSAGAMIATITDLSIDRRSGAVAVAVIAPAGGNTFDHRKSAVAWSSLRFEPRPTPHFVTRLDHQALAAGSALVERAKTDSHYLDVKNDLLGRQVVGTGGNSLGRVENLVLTFGSGRVAALVISTGGWISLAGAKDHAVSWDAAKPEIAKNGSRIRIALSQSQVDAAPVTATIAPAPIPAGAGERHVQVKRDSTGNISGTRIPAPQDRR